MRKIIALILFILALPIFLFVYNPSMQLGGFGLMLGGLGMTISPLIVLGCLIYVLVSEWRK